MVRLTFLFLATLIACSGQIVQSTQCWGFGGNSCTEYRFYHTSGNISCTCNALCTNNFQISANFEVFWNCAGPATGSIRGGFSPYAVPFAVRVEGDLLSEVTRLYIGHGFDQQTCNGTRSGHEFFGPC